MADSHVAIVRRYLSTMPCLPARERTFKARCSGRVGRPRKEPIGFAEGVFGSASTGEYPRALIQANQRTNRQKTSLRITSTKRDRRVRSVGQDISKRAPITL